MNPQDTIAHYRIVAKLGEGGMGAVYRATDTKLGRDVAIKVLPDSFAADPDRLARFTREAQVLASLNHPNIAAIYGVEERALVMELVEGETLHGPLPEAQALPIVRQLIEGLEYAHEKGIIHRDLKPANIKVTPEGRVKILDFGLAKAMGGELASGDPGISPTLTMRATVAGTIMGTAAYMAPEQARGHAVDKRADIWAFGVVLWEILTGQQLFGGATISDTLAAVLKTDPDWSAAPAGMRPLLRRCLEKDPRKRLRDIGDASLLLEAVPAPVAAARGRAWLPWSIAALLLAGLAPMAFLRLSEKASPPGATVRLQMPLPQSILSQVTVSPDGRHVGLLGTGSDGEQRLWVRSLDSLEPRPLPGTEIVGFGVPPYWSPDSRFLVFYSNGSLKKIDISGGPPQTICSMTTSSIVGGAWNHDGVILVGQQAGPLLRVSTSNGAVTPATAMDSSRRETRHAFPVFLPDGRHFIYHRGSTMSENAGIYLGSLDAKPEEQGKKLVLATGFRAELVPSSDASVGHLLFQRERMLMTQLFDERQMELIGEATPIAEVGSFIASGFFSASQNGVLIYRAGAPAEFQPTWFDRQGKLLGGVGERGIYYGLTLSPDGTRAAVARSDSQRSLNLNLWNLDLARSASTRVTTGAVLVTSPVWSPDGTRIVFAAVRDGIYNLYTIPASGSKPHEPLLESAQNKTPLSWSPDGRWLLYAALDPKTGNDLWLLPMDRKGEPVRYLGTEFNESAGIFSPDGKWIAYTSNESGRDEIYIRAFPDTGEKFLISRGGGRDPHWPTKSRELFYLSMDGKVTAVEMPGDPRKSGAPQSLFSAPPSARGWDVAADGRKFLFAAPGDQSSQTPFTVVLNWTAGLRP